MDPSATPTPAARVLDTAKVARSIETSIREQRHVKAVVTCPTRVEQAQGVDFVCEAISRGDATAFVVTQRDGAGSVSFKAAAAAD